MALCTFPVLRLPDNAKDNVLRNFQDYELLEISLISNRMKAIVKGLNLQTHRLMLALAQEPHFVLQTPSSPIHCWKFGRWDDKCFFESTVHLYCDRAQCRKKGYLLKDYVEHFLDVLNKNRLDSVSFQQEEDEFDLDVLRRGLPRNARISVMMDYSVENVERIVTSFPSVEKFSYSQSKPLERKMPKIFIQNFDLLSSGHPVYTWNLFLEELLEMNSAQIHIHRASISEKEINRFLKLWVREGSPKLKYLELQFHQGPRKEGILKGIPHRVVEQERQFKVKDEYKDTVKWITVTGGVDVKKKNGTVGTIVFEDRANGRFAISLYVWH